MMTIVDHQQHTQLVSGRRCTDALSLNVDYPQLVIPEPDDDTAIGFNDAMWGLSLLSPRDDSTAQNCASSSTLTCDSPTHFIGEEEDSQLFEGTFHSISNDKSSQISANLSISVASDKPSKSSRSMKSNLKKPVRPPRSRHRETVSKNVREDKNAVKALLTSYQDKPIYPDQSVSSFDQHRNNVINFPEVGANETVDSIAEIGLGVDNEEDCWLRVIGFQKQQKNAKQSNEKGKKPRGRPRKDLASEPNTSRKKAKTPKKQPNSGEKVFKKRGRPSKFSLENVLGKEYYDKHIGLKNVTEQQMSSNYSNSVNLSNTKFDSSYCSESLPVHVDVNSPAVIVEPVDNSIIYSDPLINIFEDVEMNNFRVCSNEGWMSTITPEAVEINDASSNKFSETYLNYSSEIASETRDTADLDMKENDLMSGIEEMVNEMGMNQFNTNCVLTDSLENVSLEMKTNEERPGEAIDEILESQTMHNLMPLTISEAGTLVSQVNENESQLSQNINSFYDFETFSSASDWISNTIVDNSTFNTSSNDNPAVNISIVNNSLISDSIIDNSVIQLTSSDGLVYTPVIVPPNPNAIHKSLTTYGIPHVRHDEVHCSNGKDVPAKAVKLGGGAVVLNLKCGSELKQFEGSLSDTGVNHWKNVFFIAEESGQGCFSNCALVPNNPEPELYNGLLMEPSAIPPSYENIQDWLKIYTANELNVNKEIASNLKIENKSISQSSPIMSTISPICPSSTLPSPSYDRLNSQTESIIGSTPISNARHDGLNTVFRNTLKKRRRLSLNSSPICLPIESEPTTDVAMELITMQANSIKDKKQGSQIDGPTPKNKFGFKLPKHSLANSNAGSHLYQHLTTLSMELFADATNLKLSDPKLNEIKTIFYHLHVDSENVENTVTGFICTFKSEDGGLSECLLSNNVKISVVENELELIKSLLSLVENYDPDIFLGYEIEVNSWGFLLERAAVLGLELWPGLSRVPDDRANSFKCADANTDFHLNIVGRIILAVEGLMKSELALYNYTFENVAYHVLNKRIPLFPISTLRDWFNHPASRWRTIQHFILRTKGNFELLNNLNLIGRTSELARLFGIQFQEVLTRGSQFRVESMMLRLCRSLKYVAVSPNVNQRASMRAPECLPLILEPVSKFFTDPVVVLDFQSLYPSIIIAYNYCYSTCFGRVDNLGEDKSFPFGCTNLNIPQDVLKSLKDKITVSPCGVAFVKSNVRKGVLPKMLEEILTARVMVKMEMKKRKHDQSLKRMLDARQLGLKLIANVTYGYTSANFSGRMPCVEIADSVVSKGRETLERAIKLVKNTSRWGAEVVYGDTDSMFVMLKGRTKEQAFEIGKEIADAVTADNPKPIKLKLEKVYLPCLLETKKRYVGFMYETPETSEPVYDAKGIETIRRDGCPAVAKILEKSLKILFRTKDISQVKTYVQHQFHKLLLGRCGIDEYIFTREYRGRHGYQVANHAPALKIARTLERDDHRSEPRIGQRVPYVIVYGKPGDILCDLVRHPSQILRDSSLRLNANYYVNNVICAALGRAFSLVGVDVRQWYSTLPRSLRFSLPTETSNQEGNTLSRYFLSTNCPVCDEVSKSGMCSNCSQDPQKSAVALNDRGREWEKRYHHLSMICNGCTGTTQNQLNCVSLDCPILFRLALAARDARQADHLRQLIEHL